jgi:4-oxalocrotonate tautomerase
MVVVQVEWLAGRSPKQKEALVAEITDALRRIGGAQQENVHVVLHDVPPSNWGRHGTRLSGPKRRMIERRRPSPARRYRS